jgi:hypothetical protein
MSSQTLPRLSGARPGQGQTNEVGNFQCHFWGILLPHRQLSRLARIHHYPINQIGTFRTFWGPLHAISLASLRVLGAFSQRVGWLASPAPDPGSLTQRQAKAEIVAQSIKIIGFLRQQQHLAGRCQFASVKRSCDLLTRDDWK